VVVSQDPRDQLFHVARARQAGVNRDPLSHATSGTTVAADPASMPPSMVISVQVM